MNVATTEAFLKHSRLSFQLKENLVFKKTSVSFPTRALSFLKEKNTTTSARVHLQIQAYESSTVDRKEMIHGLRIGGGVRAQVVVEAHVVGKDTRS